MSKLSIPVVPESGEPEGHQVFVPTDVIISGVREELMFLLDTGAKITTLPSRFSDHPLAQNPVAANAVSRGASAEIASWKKLTVDSIIFGNSFSGGELDLAVAVAGPDHGLIGIDQLSQHNCHFKFSEEILDIGEPAPKLEFLLELECASNGVPTVETRIGSALTRAIFDTGASMTVVDKTWAAHHSEAIIGNDQMTDGMDAAGMEIAGQHAIFQPCRIGGYDFPAHPCLIIDLSAVNQILVAENCWPIEVILGLGLIMKADWYFDFPHKSWAITQPPTLDYDPV